MMQISAWEVFGAKPPCRQSSGRSQGAALYLPVSEPFSASAAALSGDTENKEVPDTVTAFGFKFEP